MQGDDIFGGSVVAPDVNYVPVRNVYPTASGASLGSTAAATSPDNLFTGLLPSGNANANAVVTSAQAGSPSFGGHPMTWWVGLLLLFLGVYWLAKKTGNATDFSGIRLSAYNIFFITFTALLGLTLGKVILTKFRVPGLSQVWLAA